jgi:hypothetical protein
MTYSESKNIIYCEYCDGVRIKMVKSKNDNIRYICVDCNKQSTQNTYKTRAVREGDIKYYDDKSTISERKNLFVFLFGDIKAKNKFLNVKDINSSLKRWLDINHIIIIGLDITVESVYNYTLSLSNKDFICKNPNCENITDFYKIHKKYPNGRKVYCSENCLYEHRSIRQLGENNSYYKIDKDKLIIIAKNHSLLMKKKIKDGEFTPCVTNSWAKSMCKIKHNGVVYKYRSTWEAFFQMVNVDFQYEKLRIPYTYKGIEHNYITDFIDEKNRVVYEIKPDSEIVKPKNKAKEKYATKWCSENDYRYEIISNDWFMKNYTKYKYLVYGNPDEKKLLKNLKQFDNENKEN